MKVSLVVLSAGKASGQAIPIALPQFVIGRDPQCNLRPASPLISKKHCAVKIRQGNVYVEDYGSTNGTFLNDQPVKGEIVMKAGDVLKAGPLTFRIAIEGQPAANPTPTNKMLPAAAAASTTTTKPSSVNVSPGKSVAAAPAKPASNPVMSPAASTEDDLAALMLGSQDDGDGTSFDDSQVPGGTTIMEMSVPPEVIAAAAGIGETKPETAAKSPTPLPENKPAASTTPPPETKKPEPKKDVGSAQSAAKALLDKMYRRGRS